MATRVPVSAFHLTPADPAAPLLGTRPQYRMAVAGVIVAAALSIFPGLGSATLWEPDEPRFAEATRQMFDRGDFVTPYLNGVPRFEKPILLYWLQAAAMTVFGQTEFAARLPSALAGVGCVFLLYLLGARMVSHGAGVVAALVLATMFRFVVFARQGLTDVPAMFFVMATLYLFIVASSDKSRSRLVWLGWASVGLGVLTKGPIGLLSLVIWASYALARREPALLTRVRPLPGFLLAMAIAVPWYVAMLAQHGRAFTDFAIGHEIVERMVSEAAFAPVRSFTFYFQVWPGDAAPWSILFVAAAIWAGVRWRSIDPGARRAMVFALAWFLTVFAVFTLSKTKIPHYVLPAFPAAALLIGVFIDRLAADRRQSWWWRVPMLIVAAAAAATAVFLYWSMPVLAPGVSIEARLIVPVILGLGTIAVVVAVWRASAIDAVSFLAIALTTTFAVIGALLVPRIVEHLKPMPALAANAARVAPPGTPIGLLGRYGASSLIYYSRHNVKWLLNDDEAVAFLATPATVVAVMPESDFARLAPRLPGARVIASAEEFNVRLSRLVERQHTPGRQWVLVATRQ